MSTRKANVAVTAIIVLVLSACASPSQSPYGTTVPVSSTSAPTSSGVGVVQSIEAVPGQESNAVLGTVAGAVLGGVIGNQIGGGTGRTAATIAGAAGGGLVGNKMQKNMTPETSSYRITVRMNNGYLQTVTQNNPPSLQAGDRVRLQDGSIVERLR